MNKNFLKKVFLSEQNLKDIKTCVSYIEDNDLASIEPGKYPIDGDRIFVNIACYNTDTPENRIWEAHAKYIDLHYVIDGCEELWMNDIANMKIGALDEARDFIPLEGEGYSDIALIKTGDFCMCLPHEGHKTGVAVGQGAPIKKAIFKFLV